MTHLGCNESFFNYSEHVFFLIVLKIYMFFILLIYCIKFQKWIIFSIILKNLAYLHLGLVREKS